MNTKSKIRIFQGFWTVADVENDREALFVFGDNNIGKGKGGQAIIRDLPNAIGIPTKKFPSNHQSSFYSDTDFDDNVARITKAINNIIKESVAYEYVVLPADGFGTGLAKLPSKAPKTYAYLVKAVDELKTII